MIEKHFPNDSGSKLTDAMPLPRTHDAQLALWVDLNVDDCDRIEQLTASEDIRDFLASRFDLTNYESNIRTGILLDLYLHTVQFAKANNFEKPQLTSLFTIVKTTHEIATETSFGNLQETFSYFRNALLRHSVSRPPFSVGVFSPDQARMITEYVITTYFRHFKLYKYAFTPLIKLDIKFTYPAMPETAQELAAKEASFAIDPQVNVISEKTESPILKSKSDFGEIPVEKEKEEEGSSALKQLVKEELFGEVEKMKTSLNQALKESEERLNEKLAKVGVSDKTSKSPQKKK